MKTPNINDHDVDISKIQAGDFIDCTGYNCDRDCPQTHILVTRIGKGNNISRVRALGKWEDITGENNCWVYDDQITRHYPQANEKPNSVGDKPAKDRTLLEEFVLEAMKALIVSSGGFDNVSQRAKCALTIAQAHIKQLDNIKD